MNTIGERIDKIMKYRGLNPNSLSKSMGVHASTISNWISNKTKPDNLKLDKLCEVLNVKKGYILEGIGSINEEFKNSNDASFKKESKIFTKSVPLISQYAYAGYLSGFSDPIFMESQPVYEVKHDHNGGNYVAFEVRGDSMDDNTRDSICHGDIVLGCELKREYWADRLFLPKVFIIVHRENGIVIKKVISQSLENGTIICHSTNPSPEYRDFEINLNEVQQMFYIKEITRKSKL